MSNKISDIIYVQFNTCNFLMVGKVLKFIFDILQFHRFLRGGLVQ